MRSSNHRFPSSKDLGWYKSYCECMQWRKEEIMSVESMHIIKKSIEQTFSINLHYFQGIFAKLYMALPLSACMSYIFCTGIYRMRVLLILVKRQISYISQLKQRSRLLFQVLKHLKKKILHCKNNKMTAIN